LSSSKWRSGRPPLVKKVKTLPGVTEAYLVAGPYDVLVKLEADKFEKVAQTVTEHRWVSF